MHSKGGRDSFYRSSERVTMNSGFRRVLICWGVVTGLLTVLGMIGSCRASEVFDPTVTFWVAVIALPFGIMASWVWAWIAPEERCPRCNAVRRGDFCGGCGAKLTTKAVGKGVADTTRSTH